MPGEERQSDENDQRQGRHQEVLYVGISHQCQDSFGEDGHCRYARNHPDQGPDEKVPEADTRCSGEQIDHRKGRDRNDTYGYHGDDPPFGEAFAQSVDTAAGDALHRRVAQVMP